MQVDLGKKATLVTLSISQWYNRKTDSRALAPVAEKFEAKTSSDVYVKNLIPQSALKDITTLISQVRAYHYNSTLVWDDGGVRILPAVKFFEYTQQMSLYKNRLENLVEAFLAKYPHWITEARISKGQLFNLADYPSAAEMRSRFQINTSFLPFPTTADFRLNIDEQLKAELHRNAHAEFDARIKKATDGVIVRFRELLQEWLHKIESPQRYTLRSVAKQTAELVEMAPAFNFTNDPRIENLTVRCSRLSELSWDADEIKDILKEIHA